MARKKKTGKGALVAALLLAAAAALYAARRGKQAAPAAVTGVELPATVKITAAAAAPPAQTIERTGTREAVLNLPPLKVAGVAGRGRRKTVEPPAPK